MADSFDTSETLEWDEEHADEQVADEQDSTLAMLAILVAGTRGGGVLAMGDSKPTGCFGKGGVDGGDTFVVTVVLVLDDVVDGSAGKRYAKLLRSMGIAALVDDDDDDDDDG